MISSDVFCLFSCVHTTMLTGIPSLTQSRKNFELAADYLTHFPCCFLLQYAPAGAQPLTPLGRPPGVGLISQAAGVGDC